MERDRKSIDSSCVTWIKREQPNVCNRCKAFGDTVICGAPKFLLLFSDIGCISLFWFPGLLSGNSVY